MWDEIGKLNKPVVLYGTGNAADRILAELERRNIKVSGVFASDGFVRDREFAGFHVMSYSDAKKEFGDMAVILCFGSHFSNVIENIRKIDSEQELFAPDLPVAGGELFTGEYAEKHSDEISRTRELLADEKSREVFDSVIQYKITGKLEYLSRCETVDSENWKLLGIGTDETFLDLGAYNGDTVEMFLSLSGGKYSGIIAAEPDRRNFRKLSEFCRGLENVTLLNMAAGKCREEISVSGNTGRGTARSENGGDAVTSDTVDSMLDGREVSLIKMDVEGAEADVIEGAAGTIGKYMPNMLISAYHRSDDLWKIPGLVQGIHDGYRMYLRKSPCIPAWEVNYYFVRKL